MYECPESGFLPVRNLEASSLGEVTETECNPAIGERCTDEFNELPSVRATDTNLDRHADLFGLDARECARHPLVVIRMDEVEPTRPDNIHQVDPEDALRGWVRPRDICRFIDQDHGVR